MAKTDALSILVSAETKDKLAELDGGLLENIQKKALSEQLKNKNYSGDPTTGSVVVNRFANAKSAAYGTARAAGKGAQLLNSGKVTINVDQDKEIVEEIENKDLQLYGIAGLADRRTANHADAVAAALDRAFFAEAESAGTAVTLDSSLTIEEALEEIIQSVETTLNDFVDGVDRSMINVTMSPKMYGKMRTYIDKIEHDAGRESQQLFHGANVYSNTRQTADFIVMVDGAIGQLVTIADYQVAPIPLSNSVAIEKFYSYGTKAVMPDLIKVVGGGEES